MYSLVSAGVLALDLVKHPCGAQVADRVDRALALDDGERGALSGWCDDDERRAAREVVLAAGRSSPRAPSVLRGVRAALRDGLQAGVADTVVAALESALLGDLDGLLDLLVREADVAPPVLDAVAVAWVGAGSGPEVLAATELLDQPWQASLAPVPPALPEDGYGGHAADLRDVLDTVPRLDTAAWARVGRAHAAGRRSLRWSDAMHVACQAAVDADRVLPTARAQLAAARALRLAGVSTTAQARSSAMAVTAAVQAVCVLDLLDVDTARTLLGPWQAGAGAL